MRLCSLCVEKNYEELAVKRLMHLRSILPKVLFYLNRSSKCFFASCDFVVGCTLRIENLPALSIPRLVPGIKFAIVFV